MLTGFARDLLHAVRSLAKARAFTFVCVASLAIGMAPVIAVPYLARIPRLPPPGVDTDGLVEVITTANQARPATNSWSYADFQDLRRADTGIDMIGWATAPNEIVLPGGTKFTLWPMYVSDGYFQTLGVALARGAGFDGQNDNSVILSHQLWRDRLSSDPDILGKTLELDNVPYVIVGVAPERFEGHLGLQGRELFVPLERYPLLLQDSNARTDHGKDWMRIHGRLARGVSLPQASAAVAGVTAQLAQQYPATNEVKAGAVLEYDPLGVLDRSRILLLQAAAQTLTGIVLLVVCLNISGMMQVRSAMREKELSIRQAIGASRFRLARSLLAEAVVLAAVGGTLASVALFNAPRVISRLSGQPIPPQLQDALKVDLSMVAVCILFCLLTTLAVGLLSAMRFSRPVIISSLKDDAGAGGFRVGRLHRVTAALQVAIAVPLLVIGGVCLDRVRSTATADLGFESALLYAAPLNLDPGPEARAAGNFNFQVRTLRDTLATTSGVASATVADGLPLDFRYRPATVSAETGANAPPARARVQVTHVGDDYLRTMGIPLLSGHDFSAEDSAGAEKVTIISRPLADQLFPNAAAGAIGRQLTLGAPANDAPPDALTIIGVTGDFPTSQMSTERPQLLLPLAQHNLGIPLATDESGNRLPDLMLIARSAAGTQPGRIITALENMVREFDPEFRRERIVTGISLRKRSMDDFLTQSAAAGVAGGVILMLSALGIYGVVGLIVATRTREIAVRVALGSSRLRVLRMVLLDVVKLAAPGAAFGLVLAAAFMRLNAENMGVPLSDVETLAYVAGAAIAVFVAVLAGLAPARRAASVLPMVAMRSE